MHIEMPLIHFVQPQAWNQDFHLQQNSEPQQSYIRNVGQNKLHPSLPLHEYQWNDQRCPRMNMTVYCTN